MSLFFAYCKRNIFEIILIIVIVSSFLFRGFIAGSDGASSWFSPFYNLKTLLFSWATYGGFGEYAPQNFTSFFLRAYYSIFQIIGSDPSTIQKISWSVFFSLFGLVLYRYIVKFTEYPIGSLSAVIFVFFNPSALIFLWGKQHWAYYLTVPYLIGTYLYFRFNKSLNLLYGFYLSIMWFVFGFAFNQPAYIIPFFFIIGTIFLLMFIESQDKMGLLVVNAKFAVIFILVNFVYILPLVFGGNEKLDLALSNYAEGDRLPILRELSGVNFLFSFLNIANDKGGVYGGHTFLVLWLAFFIICFYVTIFSKEIHKPERKVLTGLLLLLLIFIFFTKGLSQPLSMLSEKIYDNNFMYIFRNFKDKFAIAISTILALFFIYIMKNSNKYIKSYLILLSLVCFILFISNRWIINPSTPYASSLRYLNEAVIKNSTGTGRVLNLPLVDYSFMYTRDPSYAGDNPLKNILHRDVIYGTEFKKNIETVEIKNSLVDGSLTEEDFYNYLSSHHIEYILNQKNSFVKEDENPQAYDYQFLTKFKKLKLLQDNDRFQVLEFPYTYGLIYSNSPVVYTKLNEAAYLVHIKNIKSQQELNFLSQYHRGWSLHLLPKNHYKYDCTSPIKNYVNNSTECRGDVPLADYLMPSGSIVFGGLNNLSSVDHSKNIWIINSEKIRSTLSNEYYSELDNGSISIDAILYFEPQKYFLFSLTVSIVAIMISTVYFYQRRLEAV